MHVSPAAVACPPACLPGDAAPLDAHVYLVIHTISHADTCPLLPGTNSLCTACLPPQLLFASPESWITQSGGLNSLDGPVGGWVGGWVGVARCDESDVWQGTSARVHS
jgi:hypothetical protein